MNNEIIQDLIDNNPIIDLTFSNTLNKFSILNRDKSFSRVSTEEINNTKLKLRKMTKPLKSIMTAERS